MPENKEKARIDAIAGFYKQNKRMPSFSELCKLWRLSSKNAVSKAVDKLNELGILEKDKKGRLIPRSITSQVKLLGSVEAGFPSPAEEELVDIISLDDLLIQNKEATYLLKVAGDSMSEAGILPGDMVIVNKGKNPKNNDIVIAEVDGEWTMKYLKKSGNTISLIPANSKYKPIKPKKELRIAGVVTAVIRQYK